MVFAGLGSFLAIKLSFAVRWRHCSAGISRPTTRLSLARDVQRVGRLGSASLMEAQLSLLKNSYRKFFFHLNLLLKVYYIELLCIRIIFKILLLKNMINKLK